MKRVLFVLACLIMVAVSIPVAGTPVQAAPALSLGDVVTVINTLDIGLAVRDAPAGNIVTRKYDGTSGSVIGGPEAAVLPSDGRTYTWWRIRWGDDGTEGWSADSYPEPGGEDYLQKQTKPVSTKFSVGQRVRVVNMGAYNYRVRTDPPALYMTDTFKHEGDTGTITDLWADSATYYGVPDVAGAAVPLYKGPANDYFYHFWKIQWDDGQIGWSAEGAMDGDYLIAISDAPALDHISITPESSTILVGYSQSYAVEAFDQYGNSLGDVTSSSVIYSLPAGCRVYGGNTVYGCSAGTYTVTAYYSGEYDTATLNVVEQPLPYIQGWTIDDDYEGTWPVEKGLPNCSVYLDGVLVTSTDENGHFLIPNLSPRVYQVRVQPPLGYYPDDYPVREIYPAQGLVHFWYFKVQTFSTFEFYPIGDQVSWVPFPVTIWVRDPVGNLDTSYSGEADIMVEPAVDWGELPPGYYEPYFIVLEPGGWGPPDWEQTIEFTDGTWAGLVGLVNDFPDVPVRFWASDVEHTGEGPFGSSDSFRVTLEPSPDTTPIVHASDISGQPDPMHPDTEYTVTAKYFDPDGRDDLKYCYLQLKHPDKPLTMMWDQATDDFWVYAGELGENYLTVTGNSTEITEGGLEGYELAWTFTINDQWPEVENAIDFGVSARDDQELTSGWDYDAKQASFRWAEVSPVLTEALIAFASDSIDCIDKLGDSITGTDGFLETANYFEKSVDQTAIQSLLSLASTLLNNVLDVAFDVVIGDLPVFEDMLVLFMIKENKSDDIPGEIANQIAQADSSIHAQLENTLDRLYQVDPELIDAYLLDLELRKAAHSSLWGISSWQREHLADVADAMEQREPYDMALRTIWSMGKILVGFLYPPAWPLLLADTALATLKQSEKLNEQGVLWSSTIMAGSAAQTSMWEIWGNTLDGLKMVAEGEQPKIPEGELAWVSDRLIDHDAAIKGHIRILPDVRLGVEAYSLYEVLNTGHEDASYKIVARFSPEPWAAGYIANTEISIEPDDSKLIRVDYTEWEPIQVEVGGKTLTLSSYRGTPPEAGSFIPYDLFARTKTGFYGLKTPFLGHIFSPTSEPGFTGFAPFPMEFARLGSPCELRVYDSMGRLSGMVEGELRQEIPNAVAFDYNAVFIFDPGTNVYEVRGMDAGTYKLEIIFVENGEATSFFASDIPIAAVAVHQYTVDWDALHDAEKGVNILVDADGDGIFEYTITCDGELTSDEFVLQTATTIDFDPDTLNLRSKGKFVTAYIELPQGYDVSQIDILSISLNGTVPGLSRPTAIGDHNNNGIPDLMVKFSRAAVKSLLTPGNQVEITITGEVAGIGFQGTDTIRVIDS